MTLEEIQNSYKEVTEIYQAGQISKEEYVNLLKGFEVEKAVLDNADELELKEQLNELINAAITIAGAAV
jgi:hypothetical protein